MAARFGAVAMMFMLIAMRLTPVQVSAANDHVTNCANSGPGSLPAVVAAAAAGATIVFDQDCTGSSAITLTVATGSINIAKTLTIDGTGHTVAVDGGNVVRAFVIGGPINVTLKGLTIEHGNAGAGGGGGIETFGAVTLYVINSTLNRNTATFGGGIYHSNANGVLMMLNSTVSRNFATNGGGGGIDNLGTLAVTNSTFAINIAQGGIPGGGIANLATLALTNTSFTGNNAPGGGGLYSAVNGTTTITNTVIANNSALSAPDVGNSLTSLGHNLIGKTDGSSGWIPSDLGGTIANPLAAKLGPLTTNGGPTTTIAPLAGSPAIGAGDPAVCANMAGNIPVGAHDQRGLPRLHSVCDIGAYQVQTHFLVSPFGGAAGSQVNISVAALDDYNNFVTAYGGKVHFTSSDPLATAPADYIFTGSGGGKDNGAHTSAAIFRTAGMQSIIVTDMQVGTVTGNASGAITPSVAAISPHSGSTAGGNQLTLTGLGFGTAPANVSVTVGGAPAAVVGTTNAQLTITAPAHAAGVVDVAVTVNGQSVTVVGGYTYGTVNPLPNAQPTASPAGAPNALPGARPVGAPQGGNPNPLPTLRP
jgi:hypothetical protein